MKQAIVDTMILDQPQEIPEVIRELVRSKRNSHLEMDSVIVVKGLKKNYGENTVVNNVSFEVEKGEIFGLLGPNGAGKSTTTESSKVYVLPIRGAYRYWEWIVAKTAMKLNRKSGFSSKSHHCCRYLTLKRLSIYSAKCIVILYRLVSF